MYQWFTSDYLCFTLWLYSSPFTLKSLQPYREPCGETLVQASPNRSPQGAGAHLRLHFWLTCTYRCLSHLYLQNLEFGLSYTYKGGVGWGWQRTGQEQDRLEDTLKCDILFLQYQRRTEHGFTCTLHFRSILYIFLQHHCHEDHEVCAACAILDLQ